MFDDMSTENCKRSQSGSLPETPDESAPNENIPIGLEPRGLVQEPDEEKAATPAVGNTESVAPEGKGSASAEAKAKAPEVAANTEENPEQQSEKQEDRAFDLTEVASFQQPWAFKCYLSKDHKLFLANKSGCNKKMPANTIIFQSKEGTVTKTTDKQIFPYELTGARKIFCKGANEVTDLTSVVKKYNVNVAYGYNTFEESKCPKQLVTTNKFGYGSTEATTIVIMKAAQKCRKIKILWLMSVKNKTLMPKGLVIVTTGQLTVTTSSMLLMD